MKPTSKVFAIVVALSVSSIANGADPWHQSFNKLSALPWLKAGLGGTSIGTAALDGPVQIPLYGETVGAGGAIWVGGYADYASQKLYLEMQGPVADHRGTAISHRLYTISDPLVAPGTAGTMHLAYSLSGTASFFGGLPPNSVTYSLQVVKDIQNNGIGGTLLSFDQKTLDHTLDAVAGLSTILVDVPFVFGNEFRVTTTFSVRIQSDQEYMVNGGIYTPVPDMTYQGIVAAFDESATLQQLYIPLGASITLNTESDFDLAPLVRYGTPNPVPLPFPLALLAPGLLALFFAGRRPASQGRDRGTVY